MHQSKFLYWICMVFFLALSSEAGDVTVEKIADGFIFTEGPVLLDSGILLFSDIQANTVYQWTEDAGASVFLNPSGNSNGLALDLEGRLLLAQHGNRCVARLEMDGTQTVLASTYNGKKLNSPNDLAVKSDGSIFFTDPPYGIQTFQQELAFSGIYRISPDGHGQVQLLDKTLYRPNGIAFSPDESKLYVDDSESRTVYIWDVADDSVIVNKRVFSRMNKPGNADGMTVGRSGRVYVTGPIGVWVYSSEGAALDTIPVPGQTTNCCWANAEQTMLYVTAGSAVYRILLGDETDKVNQGFILPEMPYLYPNFPNPFNDTTQIRFQIHRAENIRLTICNMAGESVETLMNDKMSQGIYQIPWNSRNLPSDQYLVILSTSKGIQTGRCLLLK